eukprot:SAG11_NODE_2516_length_3265_cov_3.032533_1_plen_97_part_00
MRPTVAPCGLVTRFGYDSCLRSCCGCERGIPHPHYRGASLLVAVPKDYRCLQHPKPGTVKFVLHLTLLLLKKYCTSTVKISTVQVPVCWMLPGTKI